MSRFFKSIWNGFIWLLEDDSKEWEDYSKFMESKEYNDWKKEFLKNKK
jgi:hypothetical protein